MCTIAVVLVEGEGVKKAGLGWLLEMQTCTQTYTDRQTDAHTHIQDTLKKQEEQEETEKGRNREQY